MNEKAEAEMEASKEEERSEGEGGKRTRGVAEKDEKEGLGGER